MTAKTAWKDHIFEAPVLGYGTTYGETVFFRSYIQRSSPKLHSKNWKKIFWPRSKLSKLSIFAQHFDFYEIFYFCPAFRLLRNFIFLTKITIFDEIFYLWPSLRFLTTFSTFDQFLDLSILGKFGQKLEDRRSARKKWFLNLRADVLCVKFLGNLEIEKRRQ